MRKRQGLIRKTMLGAGMAAAVAVSSLLGAKPLLAHTCTSKIEKQEGRLKRRFENPEGEEYCTLIPVPNRKRMRLCIPSPVVDKLMASESREVDRVHMANLDKAVQEHLSGNRSEVEWECIEPRARRMEMPDTSQSSRTEIPSRRTELPDRVPTVPQRPRETVSQQGNWISPRSFTTDPPLNSQPFALNGPGIRAMQNAMKSMIMSTFDRVLKRDSRLGGRVEIELEVRSGKVRKVSFKGNVNEELRQRFADIFGRIRWRGTRTIQFPFLLIKKD